MRIIGTVNAWMCTSDAPFSTANRNSVGKSICSAFDLYIESTQMIPQHHDNRYRRLISIPRRTAAATDPCSLPIPFCG